MRLAPLPLSCLLKCKLTRFVPSVARPVVVVYDRRFAGLPVLSYLRRASHHSTIVPSSRPPSYTYRRASTLVAPPHHSQPSGRPYGALGRGLAVEREEQVRRESRGLLARDGTHGPLEDGDDGEDENDITGGAGTTRSRNVSSAGDRSSFAKTTFSSAATSPPLDADNVDANDEDLEPPTTPAVVRFARISQRGARRLDPRVVWPSELGGFAREQGGPAAAAGEDESDLEPPPVRLWIEDERRGSTATSTGSRSTAFFSAPSTPVLPPSVPTLPFGPSLAAGPTAADPGLLPLQHLAPLEPQETVHLVPRKPAPAQSLPPSPRIRLTAAFRPSSDSSSYAPSWRGGGPRGSLDQAGPAGILREAAQQPSTAASPFEASSSVGVQQVRLCPLRIAQVPFERANDAVVLSIPRSACASSKQPTPPAGGPPALRSRTSLGPSPLPLLFLSRTGC